MLSSIVRFENDAAGLEKTMRLVQSLGIIVVGLQNPSPSDAWLQVVSHLMLARRFFRLLHWHPSWTAAMRCVAHDDAPLRKLLEVAKWTFLGTHLFLEMFTITNAMRATEFEWAARAQTEADKTWFYSILASILLSLYDLATATFAPRPPTAKHAPPSKERETTAGGDAARDASAVDPKKLYTQLVIDCADILNPARALNWIPVGTVTFGVTMAISSLLAGHEIWLRVQSDARET